MFSQAAIISRSSLKNVLSSIKWESRKEAVVRLRETLHKSTPMENDNKGDRQRVEIDLANGVVSGFTVTFDGVPVFRYIGPNTATELPRMFIGRIRKNPKPYDPTREDFILSFGTGFWAIIYHGCNGGIPYTMTYQEPAHV